MSTIQGQFQDILRRVDAEPNSVIEQETIIAGFAKIVPEGSDLSVEEKAEALAFSFADRFTKAEDEVYFGPRVTMRGKMALYMKAPP